MNSTQSQVLKEFCERATHYVIDLSKFKIVETLQNGITEDLKGYELNEFIANTCASFITREPDFNRLAVEYELKNIYMSTEFDFIKCVQRQYNFNLVSEKYYTFVINNKEFLINMLEHSRDYLIDFFGLKTLSRSYLLKDKSKKIIESPQMMFARCAIQIHGLYEKTDPEYLFELINSTYNSMSQLYFTHATPTLFNSGGRYPQLSSCYLLQCSDDLDGISKTISDIMKISKWAGGIGVNLSDVRADGALIKSNGGSSNGIIPLCKVLESVARYINQSGKRAGSVATYIEPWHSDIYEFIELRKNTGDENLRARDLFLALWIPNAFMRAVEADGPWYLMTPDVCIGLTEAYGLKFDELYYSYVKEGKYVKEIKARELFVKIIESQIETGMPYMLYKDHANEKSNQQNLGTIKCSNLCSEIIEYSSSDEIAVCNLASICLPMFVEDGVYNFKKLGEMVQMVVHNLNNIIDMNFYPVPETAKSNFSHRPIGLGVQGLADAYIKMGYSFDSEEASKLNRQIFECIYYHALTESNELAKKFGPYKTFENSPFSKGQLQFHLAGKTVYDMDKFLAFDWENLIESIKQFGTRNSLLTTVMPTASTAQIMNNTESVEPVTTNIYVRKVLAGEYIVVNKYLVEDLKKAGLWNEQIYSELIFDNGSVQKLDIPEGIKNKYKTAYDLKQKVIVDQSIDRSIFIDQSQSLNLFWEKPDIAKVFASHIYGWKKGLKTGMYYLKSRPASEAIKFGIDVEIEKNIREKRGIVNSTNVPNKNNNNNNNNNNNSNNSNNCNNKYKTISEEEVCTTCSA